ncbi:calcium-binding protein [Tropicimonas isoalkanivorans]|uniref:calcium-binding protein n=1 Tax=Tropicimonas isoalkanivorans TaxID=441112 RepID=UPI000A54E8E2|nr:hypothetical protein [Tropicimonas isoalkanivorans]
MTNLSHSASFHAREWIAPSNRGAKHLKGSSQDDEIRTEGTGEDRLFGYGGDDHLSGNSGDNRIFGGTGSDEAYGNQGDDILFGQRGADEIYGGYGNDTIIGGCGDDIIDGGAGADTVIFSGDWDEYKISIDQQVFTISHVGGGREDRVDRIVNVEMFQFEDQVLEIHGGHLQPFDIDPL